MEEKDMKMQNEEVKTLTEEDALNDKGFALMYNITMACGAATVVMFVIGVALYLTVVS